MITIRLHGGLGNQLFQLAAGLDAGSHSRVRFDTSWFYDEQSPDVQRTFDLGGALRAAETIRLPRPIAKACYSPRNPLALREQGPTDDLVRRRHRLCSFLIGYYQRATHPLAVTTELAGRLLPVLDHGREELAEVGTDAVGVHVRLGDYLANQKTRAYHGLTAPDFFAQSLHDLQASTGGSRVLVFTDSPEAFARMYAPHFPADTNLSTTQGAWETLAAMSRCRGLVISNSSLSWWGAFVGTQLRGTMTNVVMPQPWFAAPGPAEALLEVPGWSLRTRELADG